MCPSLLNVSTRALGDVRSNLLLNVFQETAAPLDKRFKTFCLFDIVFLPLVDTFFDFDTTLIESFENNDLNIIFTPYYIVALIKVTNFASISNYPKVLYGILKICCSQL